MQGKLEGVESKGLGSHKGGILEKFFLVSLPCLIFLHSFYHPLVYRVPVYFFIIFLFPTPIQHGTSRKTGTLSLAHYCIFST